MNNQNLTYQGLQNDLARLHSSVETLCSVRDAALESLDEGGIRNQSIPFLAFTLTPCVESIGMEGEVIPQFPTYGRTSVHTQVTLENVSEVIRKIWDHIVALVKKAAKWVKDFFFHYDARISAAQLQIQSLQKRLKTSGALADDGDRKVTLKSLILESSLIERLDSILETQAQALKDGVGVDKDLHAVVIQDLEKIKSGDIEGLRKSMQSPINLPHLSFMKPTGTDVAERFPSLRSVAGDVISASQSNPNLFLRKSIFLVRYKDSGGFEQIAVAAGTGESEHTFDLKVLKKEKIERILDEMSELTSALKKSSIVLKDATGLKDASFNDLEHSNNDRLSDDYRAMLSSLQKRAVASCPFSVAMYPILLGVLQDSLQICKLSVSRYA